VKKLLSAPRLNLSHGSPSADEAAGARSERPARSGPVTAEIRELQGQLMRGLRKLIDDVTLRRVWGTRNVPLTRFGGEPMPALIASALRNPWGASAQDD